MSDKPLSPGEAVLAAATGTPAAAAAKTPEKPPVPAAAPDPAPDPAPVPDPAAEAGEDQRVPLDRFQQVTSQNKEMRDRLAELEQKEQERQREAMSELERAQAERDEERQKREAAESKALELERGGYLRSAAAAAGFADPEDAVALIGLDAATDQLAAQQAVKDLAEKKPHLVAKTGTPGPTPIGSPIPSPSANPDPGDSDKTTVGKDILNLLTGR